MQQRPSITPILAVAFLLVGGLAQAAVTINAVESGGDVVFSGGGTLNLTDLNSEGSHSAQGSIDPIAAILGLGANPSTFTSVDLYGFTQIPSVPFGSGGVQVADSGAGDRFGIDDISGPGPALFVPDNYVSGSALSGTLTFNGADFTTLGLIEGSYVWSWGSGANADSMTLNIVPEPASLVLIGLGGVVLVTRRSQQRRGVIGH